MALRKRKIRSARYPPGSRNGCEPAIATPGWVSCAYQSGAASGMTLGGLNVLLAVAMVAAFLLFVLYAKTIAPSANKML